MATIRSTISFKYRYIFSEIDQINPTPLSTISPSPLSQAGEYQTSLKLVRFFNLGILISWLPIASYKSSFSSLKYDNHPLIESYIIQNDHSTLKKLSHIILFDIMEDPEILCASIRKSVLSIYK